MNEPQGPRTAPRLLAAQVFARDGLRCRECGATENLTVDHVVPYIAGGSTSLDNLQTLCGACNSRKGGQPFRKGGRPLSALHPEYRTRLAVTAQRRTARQEAFQRTVQEGLEAGESLSAIARELGITKQVLWARVRSWERGRHL